ncbi:hypothetical protein ATO10_15375 [Actibacterium atlanticum]|uniref:DUF805 domain-containing protein n=1 Tax=Actibacterium atlanticum TaxID=1461693 RepID=A0A058ZJ46_9RHOB|nr:DUF805 domain-containing protein [Actibacterium atlanticum]KCV80816.1 hypothetical protein ATO10_15375 [Actibacterium atlanticum]
MGFQEATTTCLRKYFTFSGRAVRSEYWYFVLFCFLGSLLLGGVDMMVFDTGMEDLGLISSLFSLATIIPGISACSRRLHDIGRSGWWQLLLLVPLIGVIILIYWLSKSGEGENKYGPVPVGGAAALSV